MMNELCFVIEERNLYMEQILVEYENVPIFYVCSDGTDFYLVLCRDIEKELYIVVKTNLVSISNMLRGRLTMREIITKEAKYWDVSAGEEVFDDIVIEKTMDQIPLQDLPYENSYFQLATRELEVFLERIEHKLFDAKDWTLVSYNLQKTMDENAYYDLCCDVDEVNSIMRQTNIQISMGDFAYAIDILKNAENFLGNDNEVETICKLDNLFEISISCDKNEKMTNRIELEENTILAA